MQKSFFVLLLFVFSLCGIASAQSGRRIKTAPTPTTTTTQSDNSQEPDYSESSPAKPLPVFSSPSLRRKSSSGSKKESDSQTTTLPDNSTKSGETVGDEDVLKVETNLITIPVSVYDRNGIYVPGLGQSDFKIFEDGKEQEVAYFGTADKPFTVVLLIDVSPSTEYKIEEIQNAAITFVDQLKPADNVMVIEFDSRVHVLTEITNNRQQIYQAIRKTGFGDGTSLYDAVDISLRKRLDKIEGRKAIVLFTDGVDTTSSRADFESTIAEAEESEALIFPIYFNTYLDMIGIGSGGGVMSTSPILGLPGGIGSGGAATRSEISAQYTRGKAYLEYLAAATGGRVYRPESTPGGLTSAFEGIAEELRRQYNIGYYPQDAGQAGQRKQIKVRVQRPNVVVRARDSYIVGGGTQAESTK